MITVKSCVWSNVYFVVCLWSKKKQESFYLLHTICSTFTPSTEVENKVFRN